ncbi:MAG: tRNA pseudouridine(55) synthase TruB [Neisseriaceae bacterium]|nr:tRNA pseudouridine(55) synthase TruB [Neisseriaceae bacterium]
MAKNFRQISGVLLLDKASGVSSNTALQQVRHCLRAAKAGHTGVLDPLATGLLPICLGEATKFAQYLLDADKAYIATLKLGEQTNTGDADGEIIATTPHIPDQQAFQAACNAFLGEIEQTPPMYSALKFQGKALYEYARLGIEIERKKRQISIHHIDILEFNPPLAKIFVSCSKGTYIRVLAEDIAKFSGSLSHLTALRRVQTAGFSIENAITFNELQNLSEDEQNKHILPVDNMLQHFLEILLPENHILSLQQGKCLQFQKNQDIMNPFRVFDMENRFIGLAKNLSGSLKALRLMSIGGS